MVTRTGRGKIMLENHKTSQTISLQPEVTYKHCEKAEGEFRETILHRKLYTALASNSEIEYCSLINRITAAVETGGVHAGTNFLPEPFATTDGFEEFLNEMEIFYKHSVENWRHAFKRIVEATDEIRQENELDD